MGGEKILAECRKFAELPFCGWATRGELKTTNELFCDIVRVLFLKVGSEESSTIVDELAIEHAQGLGGHGGGKT